MTKPRFIGHHSHNSFQSYERRSSNTSFKAKMQNGKMVSYPSNQKESIEKISEKLSKLTISETEFPKATFCTTKSSQSIKINSFALLVLLGAVTLPAALAMQTTSSSVVDLTGISRADALEGLWKCSKPARFFKTIPDGDILRKRQEADAWKSKKEVEIQIQERPFIDYFGGRCIKTDMSEYPKVDIASYKKQCEIEMSYAEIREKCLNIPKAKRVLKKDL